jgi:hypothetical protein
MTVDIWIRDYNPPRCFQKKISGRREHNVQNRGQNLGLLRVFDSSLNKHNVPNEILEGLLTGGM